VDVPVLPATSEDAFHSLHEAPPAGDQVHVMIPLGFRHGELLHFNHSGRAFDLSVPLDMRPGEVMEVDIPPDSPVASEGRSPSLTGRRSPHPSKKAYGQLLLATPSSMSSKPSPYGNLPPGFSASSPNLRVPPHMMNTRSSDGSKFGASSSSSSSMLRSAASTTGLIQSSQGVHLPDGCTIWEVRLTKALANDRFGFAHFSGAGDFLRARGELANGEATPNMTPVNTPGRAPSSNFSGSPAGGFVRAPQVLVVREIAPQFLLAAWNQANPEKEVMTGDRIFAVNGATLVEDMQQELRGKATITLKMMRYPQVFPVELKAGNGPAVVGISAERLANRSAPELRITEVSPHGALEAYNQLQIRLQRFHLVVTPGMFVRKANNAKGDPDLLEQAIRSPTPMMLYIRRGDQAMKPKGNGGIGQKASMTR